MTVYDILNRALVAAAATGEVTADQARLASLWVDVQESADA